MTNSGNGGIIKEQNNKPITEITDKAIERVPKITVSGYTDDQCSFIQQQHRELLKYARDKNGGKEVAFIFRKDLSNRSEYLGTDDSLDLGTELMSKGNDIFIMHNHPRNSSFSNRDILLLLNNDTVKALSIVKNNGNVEVLSKTDEFNTTAARTALNRAVKKHVKNNTYAEIDKAIAEFLKKYEEGLKWTKE